MIHVLTSPMSEGIQQHNDLQLELLKLFDKGLISQKDLKRHMKMWK